MKDTVYLLYNTNASDIKLRNQKVNRESDYEYIDEDRITLLYCPEDVRKHTEIKIHSKTKLRDRPKSAGEVATLPKINVEGVLIKRSISLSNIEEFFLKRRIPLIKPLLSEREILKLQLLQEQCRKKRTEIEADKTSLKGDIDDKDLRKYKGFQLESEEENLKDKARDATSPLISAIDKSKEDGKKPGDKSGKESEQDKRKKSPASGKSGHEAKKLKKEPTSIKPKSGKEKDEKKDKPGKSKKEKPEKTKPEKSQKEKQKKSLKEKVKTEKSAKGEQKPAKDKTKKSSSEGEFKPTKQDSKTKDQTRTSKSKERKSDGKKSGESSKHGDSDKSGSKGSSRKSSKQKLKSEKSEKDVQSKKSKEHSQGKDSKEKISHGKKSDKSDKSDKSESNKSRKMSDSSKKRKGKDEDSTKTEMKDEVGKMKPEGEAGDKKKVSDDATIKSGVSKKDKKGKPGSTSDRTSDHLSKEKGLKPDAEEKNLRISNKKSVKFPAAFQHIIHYVLSNPLFVKLGWTLAPSDRAQLQVITFRAVPALPHTYCFRERTEDEIKYYSKAMEIVAFHFRTDGTGKIFYPSGVPAATITKHSTGMRLVLYSNPLNDPLIRDSFNSKVLGIFDSYGNGVVYDSVGKKLLNFNQLEGLFCSPHRKSPYKWQWCDYKILDRQRIKALLRHIAKEQKQPQIPIKKTATPTSGSSKKPKSDEKKEVDEAYQEILAELPYPVLQKTKTKSENQFWGFKPITLKINSEMTLRINGQDDVAVNFSSNQIFLRIDLGVKVDPDVVERIEALKTAADIPCVFDGLLEPSPSLQQLTAAPKKVTLESKLSGR